MPRPPPGLEKSKCLESILSGVKSKNPFLGLLLLYFYSPIVAIFFTLLLSVCGSLLYSPYSSSVGKAYSPAQNFTLFPAKTGCAHGTTNRRSPLAKWSEGGIFSGGPWVRTSMLRHAGSRTWESSYVTTGSGSIPHLPTTLGLIPNSTAATIS